MRFLDKGCAYHPSSKPCGYGNGSNKPDRPDQGAHYLDGHDFGIGHEVETELGQRVEKEQRQRGSCIGE
jgi:hypothetical protein